MTSLFNGKSICFLPSITSNRKNKFTSGAEIYLGAIVTNTKGIATHIIHIKGTIILSAATRSKFSTKKKANIATTSFPITADGTKSLSLANLARFAFIARPSAVTTVSYTHLRAHETV